MCLETEWVEVVHTCTPERLFSRLREIAEACVINRNSQIGTEQFSVHHEEGRPRFFSVNTPAPRCPGDDRIAGVFFLQNDDHIAVEGNGIDVKFNVYMGLNDETGTCGFQLLVPDGIKTDVKLWQVLYRALEPLLFRDPTLD